jgi:hypothetical protein
MQELIYEDLDLNPKSTLNQDSMKSLRASGCLIKRTFKVHECEGKPDRSKDHTGRDGSLSKLLTKTLTVIADAYQVSLVVSIRG